MVQSRSKLPLALRKVNDRFRNRNVQICTAFTHHEIDLVAEKLEKISANVHTPICTTYMDYPILPEPYVAAGFSGYTLCNGINFRGVYPVRIIKCISELDMFGNSNHWLI